MTETQRAKIFKPKGKALREELDSKQHRIAVRLADRDMQNLKDISIKYRITYSEVVRRLLSAAADSE